MTPKHRDRLAARGCSAAAYVAGAVIRPETMTLFLLVLGLFAASLLSPYFLDVTYILDSFTLSAEFAIVALVLTMVIISGEIDLSPASNMALSACLFAWAQQAGVPMPLAIGLGWSAGLVMGALNAFMMIRLQIALDHRDHRHADAVPRPRAGDCGRQVDPGARLVHRHQQRAWCWACRCRC